MTFTKPFNEIGKDNAAIAGGKGASLGEMTRLFGEQAQAHNPIPAGFVILASAFDKFLADTDIGVEIDATLDTVNVEKMHTVEHASEKIQNLIMSAQMPAEIVGEILEAYHELSLRGGVALDDDAAIPGFFNGIASSRTPRNDRMMVAVRSSATAEDSSSAAWAGQLESFLNTTEKNLLLNVQKCWASLFTPRAIFYSFEKGYHGSKQKTESSNQKERISVAVAVQAMIQSEISGIAFSVHPVTQDRNQLIIEAGYGLGEAIVSGQITPDSYVVTKNPLEIIDKNISEQTRMLVRAENGGNEWVQIDHRYTDVADDADSHIRNHSGHSEVNSRHSDRAKLSDEQILELSHLIIKIENHYGFPCDIEWAFSNGQFYITQSRPITTLENQALAFKKYQFEKIVTRDLALLAVEGFQPAFLRLYKELTGKDAQSPFMVFYIQDGLVQEWLDKQLLNEFTEAMYLVNSKNESYFLDGIRDYKAHIDKYSNPYINTKNDFIEYIQSLHAALRGFILFYFTADDDRNPKIILEAAREMRVKDRLGDDSDFIVRQTLAKLFPELTGFENVIHLMDLNSPPSVLEMNQRMKNYVFTPGVLSQVVPLDEFIKLRSEFDFALESIPSDPSEISGQTASPGVVEGKVRVLVRQKDIEKLQPNEVLVSTMTTPIFVPAMRKALAIITDEGGITCHAAIISRELKKPCIIGTKIATQVLHDGDLVKVDADNGVVRVLERATAK